MLQHTRQNQTPACKPCASARPQLDFALSPGPQLPIVITETGQCKSQDVFQKRKPTRPRDFYSHPTADHSPESGVFTIASSQVLLSTIYFPTRGKYWCFPHQICIHVKFYRFFISIHIHIHIIMPPIYTLNQIQSGGTSLSSTHHSASSSRNTSVNPRFRVAVSDFHPTNEVF